MEEDLSDLDPSEYLHTFHPVSGPQLAALSSAKGHSSLYWSAWHVCQYSPHLSSMSSPLRVTQEFLVLKQNKQKLSVLETLNPSSTFVYLQCPTEFTG